MKVGSGGFGRFVRGRLYVGLGHSHERGHFRTSVFTRYNANEWPGIAGLIFIVIVGYMILCKTVDISSSCCASGWADGQFCCRRDFQVTICGRTSVQVSDAHLFLFVDSTVSAVLGASHGSTSRVAFAVFRCDGQALLFVFEFCSQAV